MYATLKKRTIGTSPSPATYDEFRQVPASADSHLKVELRRKAGLVAAAAFLPSLLLLPVLQVDEKTSSAPSEREAFRVTWLPDPDELFQVVPWNSGAIVCNRILKSAKQQQYIRRTLFQAALGEARSGRRRRAACISLSQFFRSAWVLFCCCRESGRHGRI